MPDIPYASKLQNAHIAGQLLALAGLKIAVAESCTGGLLGAALTSVAGSSSYFLGGVIAYDDRVKRDILRVPGETIVEYGAVSAPTALAMAHGVRALTGVGIALSVTGISGPGGGTEQKPVGTTYIGLVAADYERVEQFSWTGDRAENRAMSVDAALRMLIEYLNNLNTQAGTERKHKYNDCTR